MLKKDLFHNPDAFGTALVVAVIDDYGVEALDWELDTLAIELQSKYGDIPDQAFNRLGAAMTLLTSNSFFTSLDAFNTICSTLAFQVPVIDQFIPSSLEEVVWGLTEARLLLGEEEPEVPFVRSIRIYVGKLLEEEGILSPPEILNFAQMTKLGDPDLQIISDMPDITEMFEASQSETKKSLDGYMLQRAVELMRQIGELSLENSDLSTFHEKVSTLLEAQEA